MLKRSVLFFVALLAFLANAGPVQADDAPILVYVDTAHVGPENGTEAEPYNTLDEGIWKAQHNEGGGVIMLKTNGVYEPNQFVDSVLPGQTGIPLAKPVLYGLLLALTLLLILAGWQLRRRSRQLQHK
jgi:hypothetical protein